MAARDLFRKLFAVGDVRDHYACALGGERLGIMPANAFRTASHDCGFSRKSCHKLLPARRETVTDNLISAMKIKTEAGEAMPRDTADRLAIRALIENWVLWRDARMWDRFRTVWHKDGQMWATWFQGSYEEFIRVSQEGYDRGVRIMHMLGGMSIDLKGKRAIAQTKMTISQRAMVEGVLCDVVCSGRFYDFLEKRKGKWGIVLRRLAYEKDRIDPVEPDARLSLDKTLLAQFPEGYRHLAYLQSKIGYKIKDDIARPRRAAPRCALRQGRGLAQRPQAVGASSGDWLTQQKMRFCVRGVAV